MIAKHTPGPWVIDHGYDNIINSIGPLIPNQYAGSTWLDVTKEDARLIAAAPVLLEALKDLADLYDTDEGCRSLPEYIAARAAIAKAIG